MPTLKRKVVRLEAAAPAGTEPPVSGEMAANPMFGVAMLKIAMELKRPGAGELEEILQGVLRRMNLDEAEFRGFLAKNGGLLRAIAQKRRY